MTISALVVAGMPIASIQAQDSSPQLADSAYVPGQYRIYTGAGERAEFEDLVAMMGQVDVVFVGETHDDPTGHALELDLLSAAYTTYGVDSARPVVLSLEFFQRDVQPVMDEYLAGLITERSFLADSRPWPRYASDYRPMVEFAKEHSLPVIAANAPRRYANRVTRLGRASLADLNPEALASLAPLPYGQASDVYRDQWIQTIMEMMELETMKCGKPIVDSTAADSGAAHGHQSAHGNMGNQLHSQVLWDATMAYWINDQLVRRPDALVLHMVGSFHVERGTGIPEQLQRYRPGTTGMIVVLRPVEDIDAFEPAPEGAWGDFVIQTEKARTLEAIECQGGE